MKQLIIRAPLLVSCFITRIYMYIHTSVGVSSVAFGKCYARRKNKTFYRMPFYESSDILHQNVKSPLQKVSRILIVISKSVPDTRTYRVFGNSIDKFSEIVEGTIRIIFCK